MKVTLRIAEETASCRRMEVARGATVGDALLQAGWQGRQATVIVNGTQVQDYAQVLNEDDELLLIEPIIGG